MLNFDPTAKLPFEEEWKDPKLKYIPPEGIGANPTVYFNNLLMLVLDCNCPPSPRGLYHSVIIAKEWIPWLKAHPAFDQLAMIESQVDDLTGEEVHRLWRLQDWKESEQFRAKREAGYKASADEWWRLRLRTYRCVCHLYDVQNCGWKTAKDSVASWAKLYYMSSNNLPPEAREVFRGMLDQIGWFAPISAQELEDFKDRWRVGNGHLYDGPFDITGFDD